MSKQSDPNIDSNHRLQRLVQLNRNLDEIIREGDAKLDELGTKVLAHAAQSTYAVAIENLELQKETRDLTAEIKLLTVQLKLLTIYAVVFAALAFLCAAGQFYYARRSYILALSQSKPQLETK